MLPEVDLPIRLRATGAKAAEAWCTQNSLGERQTLEIAMQCYQGDLLPSCYDEWIQGERNRLRQRYLSMLERLIELLEEASYHAEAIRVA